MHSKVLSIVFAKKKASAGIVFFRNCGILTEETIVPGGADMDSKALYKLTYGLYLLSAKANGRDNACIINTAVQIANDPARISVAVIKGGFTHDMISDAGAFNISPITVDAPFALFQHFGMQSGRNAEKCAGRTDLARSANGLCYLTENAGGYLSCRA